MGTRERMRRALVSIFRRIEGWSRNAERQELYSQFAAFGRGSRIDLPVHVLNPKHIYVGSRVLVHPYCRLEAVTEWKPGGVAGFTPRLEIEDDVMIQYAVHIGCNHHVRIGARTGIGSRCFITDHEHVFEDPEAAPLYQGITHGRETILEEDCYLGEGVVVLAGVRIGRHSVIGSNSVVNRDIPPYSIALGVPARVVRQYDREQRSWKTRVG